MRVVREYNALNLTSPSSGLPDLDKDKEEDDAKSLANAKYRLDFFKRYKIDKELKDEQRAKDKQLKAEQRAKDDQLESSVRKVTMRLCSNVARERISALLASPGPTCHDNTNTAEEEESAAHDAAKMWQRPACID